MILPTTVTGSYPRPQRFDRSLEGRSFKAALGDSLFREQYLDAVTSIIAEQEAAGLDIVTDGDSRFDLTGGGKSWFFYPIERLGEACRGASPFYKCVALVEGTNMVRREPGLPEARVRVADPSLWFATR